MQNEFPIYTVGIDIGSTTAKLVITEEGRVLYEKYERHLSRVREKTLELLEGASHVLEGKAFRVAVSGSAGLGMAEAAEIPFVQEVFATAETVRRFEPDTSVVIELGGEDAKIIFLDGGTDERMNGSCAGGTGAFIDQMASLLSVDPDTLDALSLGAEKIYPIASRCGVFAKTDIQPLLNQGARHEDIAASIYQAVVNQTIAGLAQGKSIKGKVLFLGGPLHYCKGLGIRFKETLKLSDENAVFPSYALYAVALGTAIYAEKNGKEYTLSSLVEAVKGSIRTAPTSHRLPPLFENEEEYDLFRARHEKATVLKRDIAGYAGCAYLGIDCGSTTTKLVLLSENKEILYEYYASNRGNPVEIIRTELSNIYALCADRIKIEGSAVTGYGEELIRAAFGVDKGLVETVAHYTAAKHFLPNVDFILDIGGQDIKCFRIRGGAIDSIMLNEACSSGCGSFVETFARAMGMPIAEFAKRGLFSRAPADLGSRCTVFMNSSVKQSQKDGATVEDISAGLSVSVVKNALYKVIRAGSAEELGENIVVQGGTFYNDAVLRAFEKELGKNVVRPTVAGLMGAYGAALYAMDHCKGSSLISKEKLESFAHSAKSVLCNGCTNRCHLTVNDFGGGKKYISGNRCEKGLGKTNVKEPLPNLYAFKRNYLTSLSRGENKKGKIGLPLALGMYELLPLWHGIFYDLGFEVALSPMSTRRTYEKGQFSIPSDTVCYPAKIAHGHIETLLDEGVDAVFAPCLSYNIDEKASDNHYNCPVVAYYPELLKGNMERLNDRNFLYPYLDVNHPKKLAEGLFECLSSHFDVTFSEIKHAVAAGFKAFDAYMKRVKDEGKKALRYAEEKGLRVMILAGRPYHVDAEISHGIDELAASLGFVVVSEDSVAHLSQPVCVRVLNQWTYHARLYRAAKFACRHKNTELVQLVSFGCGVDAVTTDEVRSILEEEGKLYTQIKIDEITNLGAVKIRLRSLIGALEEKERKEV